MAEYICRESALEAVCQYCCEYDSESTECICSDRLAVLKIPTADVANVRHGRWLCVDTDTEQFFLCDRCKKKEYWESNYCPNCGTLMDKEEE